MEEHIVKDGAAICSGANGSAPAVATAQEAQTPKPVALDVREESIPAELKAIAHWVVWPYVWNPKKKRKDGSGKLGEWDKPPHNAQTGRRASSTDPSTWFDFATAMSTYCKYGDELDGIGIVLTEDVGIVGVDLDHCRNPDTGQIEPWAQEIIDELRSYTEVSPSATGIRIVVRGTKLSEHCKKGDFEVYSAGRYLTITGHSVPGTPETLEERTAEVAAVCQRIFGPENGEIQQKKKGKKAGRSKKNTKTSVSTSQYSKLTDEQIIEKASTAKNGEKFKALWSGDASAYKSESEADLALCSRLAFWTGSDRDRIDKLFRKSGLMRKKWDEREDYRNSTIKKALEDKTEFYMPEGEQSGRGGDGDTIAGRLVKLVLEAGIELWHCPQGNAYATLPGDQHHANYRVRSKAFRDWCGRQYYVQYGRPPGSQPREEALTVLEGMANYGGPEHAVYVRIAEHQGKVYLDLGDDRWRAVEISTDGWRTVDTPPVRFRRAKGMLALPEPVCGGSIDVLRQFINVAAADWPLVLAWLVAAMRPRGPYPLLGLHGEQGSAKSTTARVLRSLLDPNVSPIRAEPQNKRDLAIMANNSWVVALDNVSDLPRWLSDALCRLATGGGSRRGRITRMTKK
jgi:hypothetical protein